MFPRIVTIKQGDKIYHYLRLVKSYRVGKRTRQRVVANIGNIEALSIDEIMCIIGGLMRFTKDRVNGDCSFFTEGRCPYSTQR